MDVLSLVVFTIVVCYSYYLYQLPPTKTTSSLESDEIKSTEQPTSNSADIDSSSTSSAALGAGSTSKKKNKKKKKKAAAESSVTQSVDDVLNDLGKSKPIDIAQVVATIEEEGWSVIKKEPRKPKQRSFSNSPYVEAAASNDSPGDGLSKSQRKRQNKKARELAVIEAMRNK